MSGSAAPRRPRSLSSSRAPPHGEASTSKPKQVGASKTEVVSPTVPGGTQLLNATADTGQKAGTSVRQGAWLASRSLPVLATLL